MIDEGIGNYANSDKFTEAEKIALRYAELMGTDPSQIDAAFHDELKKHYTTEEIVELGAFIGFNVGYHTFFGTLDFYPMFTPDGRLVDQEESRRIYGAEPVSHLKGAAQRAAEAASEQSAAESAGE